jgi:hypothetical protein
LLVVILLYCEVNLYNVYKRVECLIVNMLLGLVTNSIVDVSFVRTLYLSSNIHQVL